MTKKIIAILATGLVASLHADIIDEWTFAYPDGTGVGEALSLQGADWGSSVNANATVQDGELEFFYDGSSASTFRNATPSSDAGATAGQYQLSWTYTSVDFSLTHANTSTNVGRVGFGIRSTVGTVNSDVNLRLIGVGNEIVLERSDANNNNTAFTSFSGSTLVNLQIRLFYDLDNRGNAGSFQVYYTPNGGSEVAAITDGTLHSDFELDAIRMIQQTTNGGASWVQGDTVRVDNMILESVVPEPSMLALVGLGSLLLIRRRCRG